jgi:hypothetical protein
VSEYLEIEDALQVVDRYRNHRGKGKLPLLNGCRYSCLTSDWGVL